ncbi:hypothetical protein AGABI2DRAFT_65529 [Agaricus bisporus var. bisporus H97]|uniref:hypothetical protein n=1 Tax=Agaricus bisporus var. bisporus (strain H97 / ATCC MYA-4626 / FGSC 10389) TaxID=936046 RepID=UPI00029F6400|nr:hypothetical protein AGABI2DRAFT_65529 [Agaricus bisporus var. bisporus H97]EKV49618.1 hypothetical protein AGABI2DRAFT_65529 [Agaricus bisporus var. bisporus H97]
MSRKCLWLFGFLLTFARLDSAIGNCNPLHDRLDPISHKFVSSCPDSMYCAPLDGTVALQEGICQPRVCRRDEYLFGFSSNDTLPPLCPRHGPGSYFCPDNGGGCQVAKPPGSDCELARDEQCVPPSHSDGQSVCLNQKCLCIYVRSSFSFYRYANATLFSPCVMENTTYTFQASYSRTSHTVSVVRHNCVSHTLHCDPSTLTCATSKKIGEACEADFQCETVACERGVCYPRADSPNQVPVWQVLITVIAIITAMIVTIFVLIFNHRRRKLKKFRELREYYVEQLRSVVRSCFEWVYSIVLNLFGRVGCGDFSLRRTIIAMHTTTIERGKS